MAEEKSNTAAEPAKGDNNKLLLGLLVLNILVIAGVGAVVFLGQKKQDAAQSIDKIAEGATQEAAAGEHGGGGGAHGEPAKAGEHGAADAGAKPAGLDVRFFGVGDFTANLSGPGATHYVRINISLELDKKIDEEEVKKRTPQIRDRIFGVLNSKRPQDLQTPDGRNNLKKDILESINAFLQTGQIVGVYFSTFVFE